MNSRTILAVLIIALGALITVVNLRDGIEFSFPFLLGLLLVVDGILRFALLREDGAGSAESH